MKRIMVLDGDVATRRFVSIFLESLGHRVRLDAGSGHVGLAALAREPEGFDVVISELRMPVSDGLDVLASSRELASRGRPVPVVLASRSWTEEERSLARSLGAFAILEKPFDLDRLARSVEDAGRVSSWE